MRIIKNPDTEFVKNLKKRIKDNGGYCPCKIQKTRENKCPCRQYRDTQDCDCGLYIKIPEETDFEGDL